MQNGIEIDFGHNIIQDVILTPGDNLTENLKSYTSNIHPDLHFCCFDGALDIDHGSKIMAVSMKLPKFFDGYSSLAERFQGLFLFKTVDVTSAKAVGKYGCPIRLYMNSGMGHFEFMDNNFYPMLTVNGEIGYYVCEKDGEHTWPEPTDPDYYLKHNVSINFPMSYDPMLGLFTTRDADAVK